MSKSQQPASLMASVKSMVVASDEGCPMGTMTLSGPTPVVNYSGYYIWWAMLGWVLGAHRFYLGQWLMGFAWIAAQITGWTAFVVWAVALLFSTSGSALIAPVLAFFMWVGVSITWVLDGFRGFSYVDEYNAELDVTDMAENFAKKQVQLQKRLGRLGAKTVAWQE